LVDLVAQLMDQDLLAATDLVDVLDGAARPHIDAATAGLVDFNDTGTAVDDTGGGEIGARDVLHQLLDGHVRVGDQRQATVDHFGQVVRRNVGRHADGDTTGAVDQQVGHAGWQHLGNLLGAVVVRHPV